MMEPIIASTQIKRIKVEYLIIAGLLTLIMLYILRLYAKLVRARKQSAFLARQVELHQSAAWMKHESDSQKESYQRSGTYLHMKPTLSFGLKIDTEFPFIIERKGRSVAVQIAKSEDEITFFLTGDKETWFVGYNLEDMKEELSFTPEIVAKITQMLTDTPSPEAPPAHDTDKQS